VGHQSRDRPGSDQSLVSLRGLFSLLFAIVAGVAAAASLLGFLTRTTLVDTHRFVATVAPLSRDPVVIAAVSEELTDQIVATVGPETVAPDQLVRTVAERTISSALRTHQFQQLWVTVLKNAHHQVVAEVRDKRSGAVSVSLHPAAVQVLNTMSDSIPSVGGLADTLPHNLGRVTVLTADQAVRVRSSLRLLDLSLLGTSLAFVVATISTLLISPSLRQGFIQIGLAVAAAAALQWVGLHLLSAYLVAQVPSGTAKDLAHRVAAVLAGDLLTGTAWLGLLGLALVGAAVCWPRLPRRYSA
jgi:hypothetical protein